MRPLKKLLSSFRTTCITVGILNILFASSMFLQGVMNGIAEFNVPDYLLTSPYYADAMFFVFLHMFMMGVLLCILGWMAENPSKQVWAARILVLVHITYAVFDIQTSDNYFGNALYQGPKSVIPVFIDLFYALLFLRLSFSKRVEKPASYSATV